LNKEPSSRLSVAVSEGRGSTTPDKLATPVKADTSKRPGVAAQQPAAANNRPTYRTNKKLTQRQIKHLEQELVSRRLMKEQLKVT
jgi:hypothetical protein